MIWVRRIYVPYTMCNEAFNTAGWLSPGHGTFGLSEHWIAAHDLFLSSPRAEWMSIPGGGDGLPQSAGRIFSAPSG
jgi:hypothetical protein